MTALHHPEQVAAASLTRRAWWSLLGFVPGYGLSYLLKMAGILC